MTVDTSALSQLVEAEASAQQAAKSAQDQYISHANIGAVARDTAAIETANEEASRIEAAKLTAAADIATEAVQVALGDIPATEPVPEPGVESAIPSE